MSSKSRVYSKFTAKGKSGEYKLVIQELPVDRTEEFFDLFKNYFIAEETFHKAAGINKSEEALEELLELYHGLIGDCKVIVCNIDDGSETGGQIVAASVITLEKRGGPDLLKDIKPQSKELVEFFKIVVHVSELYSVKKAFDLDSYYDGRGVVVHADYRGLGLAQKLFRVRREICKEEGVPLTSVLVTGIGSQKAAERDGWETVFEISYQELGDQLGIQFEGAAPMCKYMVAKPI